MKRKIFNFFSRSLGLYPESVVCPFCFHEIDRNRVLFRKSEGEQEYDVILREYLHSVRSPNESKSRKTGRLIDPEYYPQRNLVIDKNRISAVIDSDSAAEMVTQAVCPFCHNRLSDFILDTLVKSVAVLGQKQNESVMQLISRMRHANRDIEIRRKLRIGESMFQYLIENLDREDIVKNYIFTLFDESEPETDEEFNLYFYELKKRAAENSDACVLYVELHENEDYITFINEAVKLCGGIESVVEKPIAVCAEIFSKGSKGSQGSGNSERLDTRADFEKKLMEKYPDFFNQLHNYFENYKVFVFSDGRLISSKNPVEWVFSKVRQ